MRAQEITLVQTCSAFPEQYDALGPTGDVVGYLRLRWGYFMVYCPDAGSDDVAYQHKYPDSHFMGRFPSNKERKKQLRKARAAIALWWNHQNPQ